MMKYNVYKIVNNDSHNSNKNEEVRKNEAIEEQNLQTTQKRVQPKINISRLPPGFANQKRKKQIEPLIINQKQQQVQQNIQNIESMQGYKQVSQMLSPLKALIIHEIIAQEEQSFEESISTLSLVYEGPKENS